MGVLLIEVFKTPFNQQNDGHLDRFRVAIYYLSEFLGIIHISRF